MKWNDLMGRTAIVTGAAGGIGAASARILAEHGANVVLADINAQQAAEEAARLGREGLETASCRVDVSDPASVDAMMDFVIGRYGRLHIMVNNAGIISNYDKLELHLDQWNRVLSVNQTGVYLCLVAAVKAMLQHGGKIVNMASLAGEVGGVKVAPDYSCSKAAVINLTKVYAKVGAPYQILVNSICPGLIATEMTGKRDDPKEVPIGRLGNALDIARVVYFLCSELSDYVTGANIDVNGGTNMLG